VRQFEHPITSNVISLSADIFPYVTEKFAIGHADVIEKRNEVVWRISSVRATVVETGGWQRLSEQLLTAER
jgi:hypothetical protein